MPSTNNYTIRRTDLPEDEELIRLQRRFDDHLEHYEEYKKISHVCHEQNMEAIAAVTAGTAGIVQAWKVANSFQKFVRWLSAFAVLGAAVTWASSKMPQGFLNL